MTKDQKQSGRRITELMDAAGVSAEDLAKRLGTARSTVYHWRTGYHIPSRAMQTRIAKELDTSVAAINGWAA